MLAIIKKKMPKRSKKSYMFGDSKIKKLQQESSRLKRLAKRHGECAVNQLKDYKMKLENQKKFEEESIVLKKESEKLSTNQSIEIQPALGRQNLPSEFASV